MSTKTNDQLEDLPNPSTTSQREQAIKDDRQAYSILHDSQVRVTDSRMGPSKKDVSEHPRIRWLVSGRNLVPPGRKGLTLTDVSAALPIQAQASSARPPWWIFYPVRHRRRLCTAWEAR